MDSTNPGLLLHRIGSMMERISDKVLFEDFGLGFSQFKVLYALQHHASPIAQKDIAQFLGQTEASISRQIKLLKTAKYIQIRIDDRDKKKRLISLSPGGEGAVQGALTRLNMHYLPILSVLDSSEQDRLAQYLRRVLDSLAVDAQSDS